MRNHAPLTPTDLIFSSPTIASTHLSRTSLRPVSLPSSPSAQVTHAESAAEVGSFAPAFSRRRAYRIGARRAGERGETEWAYGGRRRVELEVELEVEVAEAGSEWV